MLPLPEYMKNLKRPQDATNKQYQWLYENRCEHRHRYSTHFNCFLKTYGITEKIGFLDIETSNLKANFGIVLCWCIGDEKGNIYEDYMTKSDVLSGTEDKRVIETCIETMKKFDRIVGHYSTYFDIPYLRTRALIHNIPFINYGELWHTDVWRMAKKSLCIHSNRQDTVAETLQGKTVKTRICNPSWRKATMGDEEAAKEVLDHCEKDIIDLRKNFYALLPFTKLIRSSI